MTSGPNPAMAAWSMVRARRLSPPQPDPHSTIVVDHSDLGQVLDDFAISGITSLTDSANALESYRDSLEAIDPDRLNATEALAFWMNLYNAGALWAAGVAFDDDMGSVLRIPSAFSGRWATIAGVELSLNDIEHGKIRRFGDPRIHGALVCGSASCPTLRSEPFTGADLDHQLEDQLRFFISHGGGSVNRADNTVWLSSVLKWYGRDFTSPHTMPNIAPANTDRLRDTVAYWFSPDDAEYIWEKTPDVVFMPYDWGLGCSVA
ncbi:MAG: DUF547 domain-containing protein [Actinomycetia bacterium]|nr:DUF547 domain-containing protein [Actinomycetes bacterium]